MQKQKSPSNDKLTISSDGMIRDMVSFSEERKKISQEWFESLNLSEKKEINAALKMPELDINRCKELSNEMPNWVNKFL